MEKFCETVTIGHAEAFQAGMDILRKYSHGEEMAAALTHWLQNPEILLPYFDETQLSAVISALLSIPGIGDNASLNDLRTLEIRSILKLIRMTWGRLIRFLLRHSLEGEPRFQYCLIPGR